MRKGRWLDPKIPLADGEYVVAKRAAGNSHRVTIPIIEKRFGLKPGQLINYRANHYSRKRIDSVTE